MTYFCSLAILLQCFNFFVYKKCNLCPADTWKVPWWLKCSTLSAFTFRRCKQHHFYFLRCKQEHFYFLWGWHFHFLWWPHVDVSDKDKHFLSLRLMNTFTFSDVDDLLFQSLAGKHQSSILTKLGWHHNRLVVL